MSNGTEGVTPLTCWFERGDIGYMVDALMDASDKRRAKGGRLQETIADHLDDLATRLHELKPEGIVKRA